MARVDFYHLQKEGLDNVLPKLLEKAYETGKKIKVKVGTAERVEFVNSLLWTYNDEAFLPHGTAKDGHKDMQPIYLSSEDDNPNKASLLFLVDGALAEVGAFERLFNIFDDNSAEALAQAREFWKECKSSGCECFYWQQDNKGKWQRAGET